MIDIKHRPLLAPSILAADFSRLQEEIKATEKAGADVIHLDVMDGHFVPNLTFGLPVIEALRLHTRLPFDAHLMITNPDDYLEKFAKAGCNWISVHIETCKNLKNTLKTIRSLGMQAGIAINPGTDLKTLSPYYDDCDYVLLMSVHPGFAGQKFIPDSLPRLQELVKIRSRYNFAIEVDGGIKKENAVHLMGADILVVGSGFYAESDYQSVVNEFKKIGMGWSKKHGST